MEIEQPSPDLDEIGKALESLTLRSKNNSSKDVDAISILAYASRTDPSTRQQLANPKVLQELIEVVECSINDALDTVELALRCIGNACIDNDDAKTEITKRGFSWAKQCLLPLQNDTHSSTSPSLEDIGTAILTAKVLYNVCSDYELAQQQCFREHIHYGLIPLYALHNMIDAEELPLLNELLFWICSHVVPDQDKLRASLTKILITLPDSCGYQLGHEDSALLLETCLLFLREQSTRQDVIEAKCVDLVWRMLEWNEMRIMSTEPQSDDRKLLVPLSTGLIWNMSDIAASHEFARMYDLRDEWIQNSVIRDIQEADTKQTPRLVDAACQILGNLLWSMNTSMRCTDAENIEMLDLPLLTILKTSSDLDLIHSAAGLLTQIVRWSPKSCEAIGANNDTPEIVERLCRHEMPQLKQDGFSLLRALGNISMANRERYGGLARTIMGSSHSVDSGMVDS